MQKSNPIGIFDSGIGGLTVYRALRAVLPHEDFIYLGDTARLPYGTKSRETVERYTIEAAQALRKQNIKLFTVACFTASAQALDGLQREVPDLPYCGVIAATAEAAVKATRNGRIAVLATEGTVRSGIVADVIRGLKPNADVQMLACGLMVALVEEGWHETAEAEAIAARYLSMLKPGYDTLVLGCTHFPLLLPILRKLLPSEIAIIDSAEATAQAVASLLSARAALNTQSGAGRDGFLVTDMPERFARVGAGFLGHPIAYQVTLINIPGSSLI